MDGMHAGRRRMMAFRSRGIVDVLVPWPTRIEAGSRFVTTALYLPEKTSLSGRLRQGRQVA